MNRLSSIQKSFLAVLLGLSIALSPLASMADKGDHKGRHDRNSGYSQVDRYDHVKHKTGGDRDSRSDRVKKHVVKVYGDRHHAGNRHGKSHVYRGHGNGHKYGHHGRKHYRETIVIHEPVIQKHYVRSHYVHGSALDRLSLMLGLHFDNIDIILHD